MLATPSPAQRVHGTATVVSVRASNGRRQLLRPSAAVADRRGGGAVLDRPGGFETLSPGSGPAPDSSGSKLDRSGGRGLGGGAWRVLLIDSDKHTEERVVQAITTVVPGADESHAANCFHTVSGSAAVDAAKRTRWLAVTAGMAGWLHARPALPFSRERAVSLACTHTLFSPHTCTARISAHGLR